MAYQVLARKYRPQRFSDVVGQDHVTRTLENALSQGRIAHGYIFSGHRGIGKTTIARILAMALNCRTPIGTEQRPTPEPCGFCESCTEVRAGNAVDVIEIDAATNRGIDEIRELRDAARYRPARDRYKIYILDEAHQITDAAFNALLKTLEEPPDHVVFMMATTQPEDIPQTIRSRCQHFSFHAVKFDDILLQLRAIGGAEKIEASEEALALLAEAGDGSMRDALSIMDQAIASTPVTLDERAGNAQPRLDAAQIRTLMGTVPNTVFERLLESVSENQSAPVIEEIDRLINAGNSASQLARQLVRYLRNALMARIAGESSELLQLSPDERARAGRSALLFSEEDLTRFLQVMLRTFDELNYRQEPRFHLELGVLKLVHLQRILPVEQILSQLGGGSAPAPKLGGGPLPGRSANARALQSGVPPIVEAPAAIASPLLPPLSLHRAGHASAEQPAFSPFERDRDRKSEPAQTASPAKPELAAPAATDVPVARRAEPLRPMEGESRTPAPFTPESVEARLAALPASTPPPGGMEAEPEIASNPQPDTLEAEQGAKQGSAELGELQQQICDALERSGHNTAAALLGSSEWTEHDGVIRVQVPAKKTMLALAMNGEAEKISREVLRSSGREARSITYVPGDVSPAASARAGNGYTRRPVSGPASTPAAGEVSTASAQARALENPLVKQAQELFRAEVRSVLDLRNK